MARSSDPYAVLGVARAATDAEVRTAYRRLVQRHHPDHNNGSAESARRFEEVQDAFAEIRRRRQAGNDRPPPPPPAGPSPPPSSADLEARLAEMERELREAREARERVVRAARDARDQALRAARDLGSHAAGDRGSDEQLGYVTTDDSFSKIIDDAASELANRFADARRTPAAHRVADLIDDLAAKLTGEPRDPK
jgi:curved DNA-binding protein CbpA